MRFFLHSLARHKIKIFLCLSVVIISSGLSLILGKFVGFLASQLYLKSQEYIKLWSVFALFVTALSFSVFIRVFSVGFFGAKIIKDLQQSFYQKIIRSKIPHIQSEFSLVQSAFRADFKRLKDFICGEFSVILRNFITFFGGLAMLIYASPLLFCLVLFSLLFFGAFFLLFGKRLKSASKGYNDCQNEVAEFACDNLQNIKTIKAFSSERYFYKIFLSTTKSESKNFIKYTLLRGIFVSFIIFVVFAGLALACLVGVKLIGLGVLSVGDFAEFIFYSLLVASSANTVAEIYGSLTQAKGAISNISKIYDNCLEEEYLDGANLEVNNFKKITFCNVCFGYKKDADVLKNIDLTIKKGESVAVLGPSGVGKSTLINLLFSFYKVSKGFIKVDDTDISDFNVQSLRSLFAWVSQEADLMRTTIAQNIAISQKEIDFAKLEAACIKAGIWDFIQNLPQKHKTLISDQFGQLSRGQRQRILIARAIFSGAPVMVFDEATASLDAKSESIIQETISKLKHERTIIVVAHKLSAVKNLDRIIVLKGGIIDADGTHKDLLTHNHYYKEIYNLQCKID